MPQTRAVKDLAIGDLIQVNGFEEDQIVRKAKPIAKGLDAGWLEITLVAPDGDTERIALAPQDQVTVVGKTAAAAQGQHGSPKAKERGKGKAQAGRGASTPGRRTADATTRSADGDETASPEARRGRAAPELPGRRRQGVDRERPAYDLSGADYRHGN
jgi:hypothetical protein